MRSIHRRSFAGRGVAFKTNRSEKKKQRRGEGNRKEKDKARCEAWEREAGINEEAKKRNSFFIHNVSTTY